jgi:membrane protease YdiL (CAAX protease family)
LEEQSEQWPSGPADGSRRVQAAELAVFLALILPSLVLGALTAMPRSTGFAITAAATIARDIGLVAVVLYFLWRNGEPLRHIGWNWRSGKLWEEALIGLVLFAPALLATSALGSLLARMGFTAPSTTPAFLHTQGPAQVALAVVLVIVVAVAEETIFRGYLLLRLGALTKSTTAAVTLSSILFGLGHGYEGGAGMLSVTVLGAIYALVYVWRGNLTAPIIMHFMQDFLGIVLLPHLTH